MPESWKYPVKEEDIVLVDSLAREWVEIARNTPRKAKAFDTPFRFSDCGSCSRALSYGLAGVEPDDWDPASIHVTNVGTLYHEALQAALQRRYPGAEIEVKGNLDDLVSGHCDSLVTAVIGLPSARILFELKTKGTYQMDKAVGVMRTAWRVNDPGGPSLDAVIQGGMNARSQDCDLLVIGYVCFENYSVGMARKNRLGQYDRFVAEWHIPASVFDPLVDAELDRFRLIANLHADGMASGRFAYDDKGELVKIDPEATKPHWRCDYCDYHQRCMMDGPGLVPIEPVPVELRS